MKVTIEFDHAVNDFEIDDWIESLKDNPAIYKISKDSHCGKCNAKNIIIKECHDCRFRTFIGYGVGLKCNMCDNHFDNSDILKQFPDWCPLKSNNFIISIKE